MALRCAFENNSEIGVFSKLTNSYCILASSGIDNLKVIENEVNHVIPVVKSSIAGTRVVGRLSVGNKKGLLLPNSTTDQELLHIRNSLPENIKIQRVEDRLSALGNCIATNDYVALIHPDLDKVKYYLEFLILIL